MSQVAVTRKNQIKYITQNELGVYLQLGWRQVTGTACSMCGAVPCECTEEFMPTHTDMTIEESAEEVEASAVLKPVKRRK